METGLGLIALYDKLAYGIAVSNTLYSEPKPSKHDYLDYRIATSIGYLYKKTQGNFIFRVGLAWPESMYLGFGYGF